MSFTNVATVTSNLSTQLSGSVGTSSQAILKTVKEIHQGDYEKILELVPDLGPLPAAVISLAEITFPEEYGGAIRDVTYNVTIIEQPDSFSAQAALLDQILQTFSGNSVEEALVISNTPFLVDEVKRLDYPQDYQAWNMKIRARQSY